VLFSTALTCHGIRDIEIGGMIGGATYFGDVNTMSPVSNLGPGALIFGRYNFHKQLAFRSNLSFAMLSGKDNKSDFQYQIDRDYSFKTYVFGLSGAAEFNFLPFQADNAKTVYSPYISIGLGTNLVNKSFERGLFKNIEIPISVGVKLNMPGRWNLGIEYSIRKTFRDDLDRLEILLFDDNAEFPNKQITNLSNNDWFSFCGIYLAYKLRSKKKCAAFT